MVKIKNELRRPVKVRETYHRGCNPNYTDWTDVDQDYGKFSFLAYCCHFEDAKITLNHLPRRPGLISCPNCLNSVQPRSRRRILPWTHYSALLLIPLLGCCIPYVCTVAQGKIHYCPYCKTNLGISDICEPPAADNTVWYIDFNSLETPQNSPIRHQL